MNKQRKPQASAASDDMTATQFEALPDVEKNRIWQEIDRMSEEEMRARSAPLSAVDRARWNKFQARLKNRKAGRPRFGKHGVRVIALSMERELLGRADAYAKQHGLKRAEFFTQLVREALAKAS